MYVTHMCVSVVQFDIFILTCDSASLCFPIHPLSISFSFHCTIPPFSTILCHYLVLLDCAFSTVNPSFTMLPVEVVLSWWTGLLASIGWM